MTATPSTERTASWVEGDRWHCVFCTTANPLHAAACGGCGLSYAGGLPAALGAVARGPRWWLRRLPIAAEVALALLLFAAWRLLSLMPQHLDAAIRRGARVAGVERDLHLPSEHAVQGLVVGHRAVLHLADTYYVLGHVPVLAALAGWLALRHRDAYALWRSRVISVTGVCFVLELIAVAPPRLVPALGVRDTARQLGESVYSGAGRGLTDQLSATPSVHVAWAVLVAACVVTASPSRLRRLAWLHPLLTTAVVLVTGNHFWLDALLAAAVVAVVSHLLPTGTKPSGATGVALSPTSEIAT